MGTASDMAEAIDFEKMRREMREEARAKRAAAAAAAAGLSPTAPPPPKPETTLGVDRQRAASRADDDQVIAVFPTLAIESAAWVVAAAAPWSRFQIGTSTAELPTEGAMYIPDFISEEEERRILDVLYCPAARQRWGGGAGSGLEKQRRTQNWGGRPGSLKIGEGLPAFGVALISALVRAGVYDEATAPNHVLVNEYGRKAGLVAHTDGPLYHPRVACLSLGGPASMKLWRQFEDAELASEGRPGPGHAAQIFLRPRSLNVLSGDVYSKYLHSIDASDLDLITPQCINQELAAVTVSPTACAVYVLARSPYTCRTQARLSACAFYADDLVDVDICDA